MHQDQTNRPRIVERGAALIVSLILLLIMTIIGISAMNGARLEVSMAGMMQREEVALRSAERRLTAAETYIKDTKDQFDDTLPGHYLAGDDLQGKVAAAGTSWAGIEGLDEVAIGALGEHDVVVVESVQENVPLSFGVPLNDSGNSGYSSDTQICEDSVNVYRITSRSETYGKAVRIVESMYTTKPYKCK